ncbi:MAG: homogentisate phytyltransferase, partial [Phormidesmis sp.]
MAKPSISAQSAASAQDKSRLPLHPVKQPADWLKAFWKFSRPHTIIGTSFSTAALLAIALAAALPDAVAITAVQILGIWLTAWVACLGGNIYIVGLNQIEEIAIDRINKPHLPIASGEFSKRHAQQLVWLMGIGAIALAALSQNIYLILTIGLSLIIGTAYSLPPIRLKRYPFWASMCILVVRGAIVNLGLYLYFATELGLG